MGALPDALPDAREEASMSVRDDLLCPTVSCGYVELEVKENN